MAEHAAPEYATAPGNDYASHEGTYEAFVHMAFIGTLH
ncbi:MAG TPA: aa3-type cytochrome c oxidase subunit IV, partial [Xanthobacteraceae bacterium]|nr:aa3-type cytochrome c oxidase subunit IV [Xanthobacteraceae bacterium]